MGMFEIVFWTVRQSFRCVEDPSDVLLTMCSRTSRLSLLSARCYEDVMLRLSVKENLGGLIGSAQ